MLTLVARDPSKRRVKPTPTVELFPLTIESESEDSDFKIEEVSESEQNCFVNGSSTAHLPEGFIHLNNYFFLKYI